MEDSLLTYTYEHLTNAARLLENMRDNCIKKDTDAYDDPDRDKKREALNIAIDAIDKLNLAKEKAMISQPMIGKSGKEIISIRKKAVKVLKGKGYDIVNTLFNDEWSMAAQGVIQIPLNFLASSLNSMSCCRAVYFCKGWENDRGCSIEHDVAVAYGLNIIYEEE